MDDSATRPRPAGYEAIQQPQIANGSDILEVRDTEAAQSAFASIDIWGINNIPETLGKSHWHLFSSCLNDLALTVVSLTEVLRGVGTNPRLRDEKARDLTFNRSMANEDFPTRALADSRKQRAVQEAEAAESGQRS